jgi:hypothetical protein
LLLLVPAEEVFHGQFLGYGLLLGHVHLDKVIH